ncbi:MAG: DUF3806 domain-containing protein [Haliea sp.]|nr:DUF3806 domain-containing protein [Haliea sp.]
MRNYPCRGHDDNRDALKSMTLHTRGPEPTSALEYTMRPSVTTQRFLSTGLVAVIIALALPTLAGAAPPAVEISKLSLVDLAFMAQQRASIDETARRRLGQGISGNPGRDIRMLQRLLDQGIVGAEDARALQAMGLVLGDLLASELDLHWVIYEDKAGRSRALRYQQTDHYLFPMTMISRRQQAGNQKSVENIYRDASAVIEKVRPALPFQ